jgi:hypothetical protein
MSNSTGPEKLDIVGSIPTRAAITDIPLRKGECSMIRIYRALWDREQDTALATQYGREEYILIAYGTLGIPYANVSYEAY